MNNLPKFLRSSADAEQLSLTIKGILIGIVPFLLWIANANGVQLVQGDLSEVVNLIASSAKDILTAISAIITTIGAIRKIIIKFQE